MSTGMQGIGSDLRGEKVFLAAHGQIFDWTTAIAGKPDGGQQKDGVPGLDTALPSMVAIAVDPLGNSIWVLQKRSGQADNMTAPPGQIRRVDLTTPAHTVTLDTETKGDQPLAIAADARGNLYVTEVTGEVYRIDAGPGRMKTTLGKVANPTAIAVDITGNEVFVTSGRGFPTGGDLNVYRLSGGSMQVVAGSSVPHADDGPAALAGPAGLAIGYETDGQSTVTARYLYIADNVGKRVVRVDLRAKPNVLTTVAGGGSTQVKSTLDARTAQIMPKYLAADWRGRVYIAAMDQCAIFQLQTPAAFRLPTEVTQPPAGQTNTTQPPGGGQTRDNNDIVPAPEGVNQGETVIQPGPQTQILPGGETSVAPQPQTELRIIDQGSAVPGPEQVVQPTPQPVQTPSPAAQFTPTPAPTPTPTPTPAPTPTPTPTPTPAADVSTAVVPDPGPSGAVSAEAAPVAPPPPAAAPAPASALPPAATEPVANVGLAHGDSGAPTRGATRYAMVRNDEDAAVAGVAMAAGAGLLAIFLCVMFVAPGASSKPKPRPKGAY